MIRQRLPLLVLIGAVAHSVVAQTTTGDEVLTEQNRMSFLVGTWNIHAKIRSSRTSFIEGNGTMEVLIQQDGRTIQADLSVPFPNFQVRGTTLRAFNATTGLWDIQWLDDFGPNVPNIEGRFANERFIEFDFGTDNYGPYVGRLVIYDISENSFSVRKDRLYDDGTLMKDIWVYDATRTS